MFEYNEVEDNETFWISYTDLVTGFMAIFLVITFILMAQKTETKSKPTSSESDQQGRYIELVDVFQQAFKSYDNIQVTEDGTVRFFNKSKNGEVLFENADPHLTTSFQSILSKFIPVYYEKVKEIYIQHPNWIKEIRIEGHTSSPGGYDSNLKLSTLRAYYVSQFIAKRTKIPTSKNLFETIPSLVGIPPLVHSIKMGITLKVLKRKTKIYPAGLNFG